MLLLITRNFGADRLRKQYEVLQKYYAQFPEDRERLQTLLDAVDNSACLVSNSVNVCGQALIHVLSVFHLSRREGSSSWASLHEFLERNLPIPAASKVTAEAIENLKKLSQAAVDIHTDMGIPNTVIGYIDAFGQTNEESMKIGKKAVSSFKERQGLISEYYFQDTLLAIPGLTIPDSALLKLSLQGNSISQFLRALKRNPNVHFEMYIGADDQMTPPEAAQILANYAKTSNRGQVPANLTLEIVPNQGHALDVHIPTAAKVVGSGASHPDAKGK